MILRAGWIGSMHLLALFTYLTIHQTYVVIRYSVTMYASRSFLKSDLHLHTTLPKYSTYSNIQVSSLIRFIAALNSFPKLCNVLQNFKLVLDIPLDHNKLLNFNLLQDLATRSYFHICSYMVKFAFSYFLLDNQQICLINEAQSCSNTLFFNTLSIFPHIQVFVKVWSILLKYNILQSTRSAISHRINLCFGSICISCQWGFSAGLWILIKVCSTSSLHSYSP